jgi:hypothetical protein
MNELRCMNNGCVSRVEFYSVGEEISREDGNSVNTNMNTGAYVGGGSVLPMAWTLGMGEVKEGGNMPLQMPNEDEMNHTEAGDEDAFSEYDDGNWEIEHEEHESGVHDGNWEAEHEEHGLVVVHDGNREGGHEDEDLEDVDDNREVEDEEEHTKTHDGNGHGGDYGSSAYEAYPVGL